MQWHLANTPSIPGGLPNVLGDGSNQVLIRDARRSEAQHAAGVHGGRITIQVQKGRIDRAQSVAHHTTVGPLP
jgi:hypothetical protein